jgi:hypothetical protein
MLGSGLHPPLGTILAPTKSLQPPNVSRCEQVSAFHFLDMVPAGDWAGYGYLTDTLKQGLDGAASTGKGWTCRAQETVDDVKVKVAGAVEAGGKAYRTA